MSCVKNVDKMLKPAPTDTDLALMGYLHVFEGIFYLHIYYLAYCLTCIPKIGFEY